MYSYCANHIFSNKRSNTRTVIKVRHLSPPHFFFSIHSFLSNHVLLKWALISCLIKAPKVFGYKDRFGFLQPFYSWWLIDDLQQTSRPAHSPLLTCKNNDAHLKMCENEKFTCAEAHFMWFIVSHIYYNHHLLDAFTVDKTWHKAKIKAF